MKEKERKLSAGEKKRKEVFERVSAEMLESGYKRTDLIIGVVKANVLSIVVMLPFVFVSAVIFFAANPSASTERSRPVADWLILLLGIILLAVLHEALHGLTWGAFAKSHFKSIEFGIIWKMLTPYCTCSEPLKKWQYVLGSAMPTLIIGIGLTALASVTGLWSVELLAAVLILGGGGDLIIIFKILTYKSRGETLFYDHPYECGAVAFEKIS